ncbi:MAG: beta-N-acetylhexosaminidase [Bacteroidaceae bacterium]|nr:beta-N-acetylhexosaminidase [Bacteroidaceae bacterium]
MIKRLYLLIAATIFTTISMAQSPTGALVPIPNSIETDSSGKTFRITDKCAIATPLAHDSYLIKELQASIKKHTGVSVPTASKGNIILTTDTTLANPEHYTIEITTKRITIKGASETALLHAARTMEQIMLGDYINSANKRIACMKIDDKPRYNHRAIMLDPARHFIPVQDVKFFIDQIAKYKYNILQLHLTDDQGWRVEIKSHPQLTTKGAFRNNKEGAQGPDNGYYTQEELKEIVKYAAERGIEIIPELDIPGHSVAFLTAYPETGCAFRQSEPKTLGSTTNMMLCACSETAYAIYADVFREIAEIFPSEYIHLGGDEAAIKENWAKCENCLELMKEKGYNKPEELMNIFFNKMLNMVRHNGKKPILWCELDNIYPPANDYLFPYPADVTLVTWRNALTPKCIELTHKHGHTLIMAPGEHAYLDYPQYHGDLPEWNNWGMPVTTLEKCYALDPGYGLPTDEQAHITGIMGTLWGEAIRDINRVTYMAFPRALALAEAGWTEMPQRSWESFKHRILPNLTDLMKSGVSFRIPFEIMHNR